MWFTWTSYTRHCVHAKTSRDGRSWPRNHGTALRSGEARPQQRVERVDEPQDGLLDGAVEDGHGVDGRNVEGAELRHPLLQRRGVDRVDDLIEVGRGRNQHARQPGAGQLHLVLVEAPEACELYQAQVVGRKEAVARRVPYCSKYVVAQS